MIPEILLMATSVEQPETPEAQNGILHSFALLSISYTIDTRARDQAAAKSYEIRHIMRTYQTTADGKRILGKGERLPSAYADELVRAVEEMQLVVKQLRDKIDSSE